MALYENLTASSSPEEIAAAYQEFTGLVGGDTQAAQERAVDYLTGLGISAPTITQAYDSYLGGLSQVDKNPVTVGGLDTANTSGMDFIGTNNVAPESIITGGLPLNNTVIGAVNNLPSFGGENVSLASNANDQSSIANTYKTIYGVDPTPDQLASLTQLYGGELDPSEVARLVYDDTSLRDDPRGVVKTLQQQILDQGLTSNWSGEGFGSAEANAADMARMLASAGITDVNQFGKVTVAADTEVKPVIEYRFGQDSEGNTTQIPYITGYVDANGNAVDPKLVTSGLDSEGGNTGVYTAPVGTKEVFGNKQTGIALDPRYDRAKGNIFSGTFAGEGSTGYGVQFKEDGTPVFYTQYGGSTNTLNQIMSDLGPLGQIAFAVATGGLSIPQQIAAQAALSLASGADLKDVAKNIAVSSLLPNIPTSGIITDGVNYLNAIDSSGVLGKAFASAASSGTKAALTGKDIGDAILSGAVGGGTAGAIDLMASGIEGFNDLSRSQQNMVKNAISGVVSGQPLDQVLINTAIDAGKAAVRSTVKDAVNDIRSTVTSGLSGATNRAPGDTVSGGSPEDVISGGAGVDTESVLPGTTTAGPLTTTGKGVVVTPIDAGGPNTSITTTAATGAADTEWGDLKRAQDAATARNTVTIGSAEAKDVNEAAALAQARDPSATRFTFGGDTYNFTGSNAQVRAAALQGEISNAASRSEAFKIAREGGLGANDTFTWNGKTYSAATAEERPDLAGSKTTATTAPDQSAAETARLTRQNTALVTGNAADQSAAETARLANLNAGLKSMEKTSFLGQIYKDLNEQFRLQGVAANDYLKNNPNSPITASVSSAFDAAGELQKNLGGVALALDNKPLADAIISGGSKLQALGQSLGDAPQDTKNWNDTVNLINKAKGTEKLAVLAGRVMDGTSGLARQVGLELRQELPALFLGGGLLRPTMIASGLIDTADTGGAAVVEAYDDAIKKGGTHADGLLAGRKAGAAAAATEAAIQLTLGKIADIAAGKLDNVISKGTAKVAGEGAVEGSQEAGASAAVDLALGNAIDVNKALTQGVLGAAIGKGTATATSPVDAAQTDAVNQSVLGTAGGAPTASSLASESISKDLNNNVNLSTAFNNALSNTENTGTNLLSATSSAVDTALKTTSDPASVVAAAIPAAVTAGANIENAIAAVVQQTVNSGVSKTAAVDAAVQAAVLLGMSPEVALQTAVTATTATATTATANTTGTTPTSTTTTGTTPTGTTPTGTTPTGTTPTGTTPTTVTPTTVTPTTPTTVTPTTPELPVEPTVVTPPPPPPPPPTPPPSSPLQTPQPSNVAPPQRNTRSPLMAYVDPELDSSPQFLKGAPREKAMQLAALQQLFSSLTPEMQEIFLERGIRPPEEEEALKKAEKEEEKETEKKPKKSERDEEEEKLLAEKEAQMTPEELAAKYSTKFAAKGGSILEKMVPKLVESAKFLPGAPVHGTGGVEGPLKLASIKHLKQAISAPPRPMEGLAQGGLPAKYAKAAPRGHKPEFITGLTGYYASGKGTGQSDDIPAMLHDGDYVIDADAVAALGDGSSKAGAQALAEFQAKIPHSMSTGGSAVPAKIADGEYVFPEAFVTALGGGDNKEGAKRLDAMREELRAHKRSAPTSKIPPKAKSPLDYLRMAKG